VSRLCYKPSIYEAIHAMGAGITASRRGADSCDCKSPGAVFSLKHAMRYCLRTLLIVLTVAPGVLAGAWFGWQTFQKSQRIECKPAFRNISIAIENLRSP
jgi:hypothetical protein